MDILAEHAAKKAAKLEVQSSFKPSPVSCGDGLIHVNIDKQFVFRNQKPLHSKHAPPPAKLSPPPRNPILRSAKHAPPLANPKPKAPKLKPYDVIESDQGDGSGSKEGDGSGSEEEDGDEEEDEEEGDKEDDEEKGDEEEDENKGDEEEDVNVKRNKHGRKGEGEVVMSKGKKIKVEDKEVGEKKQKKDYESSSSKDEKPLKKKTKGKGPSKPTKKVLSDNQISREKFLSDYPPLLSRTVPSSFF
nr:hypothetical protein [Tanacetum cinerariifolium]